MKIIIVGAGRIGTNLARSLASEDNEVYLIENKIAKASRVADKLDVQVIVGNGTDPQTLRKAHVEQAELVLAVTTSDDTNLVVCSLSALLGAKRRIARVRNTSLSTVLVEFGYDQFHVDEIINPELVAAQAVIKLIEAPGASEVADFADGRILLRSFDVPKDSSLCEIPIMEFRDEDFPWPFLIVAIIREGTVLIPKGDTVIQAKDRIYALLPRPSLAEFLSVINPDVKLPKKIVVYGASITGQNVTMDLLGKIRDITLIEEDETVARDVAGQMETVRIIHGSACERDILTECGIEAADIFVAASNNDHSNLISAVLAKKMGAKSTIITTQQPDYMPLINALDIDAIINPQNSAVEQILQLARGKGINAVTKLLECDAEALEFISEEGAPVTKDIIKNIKFPKNSIVGAVHSDKGVVLADGNTQIKPGEKVIVFCQEAAVKKLQAMFTIS